LDSLDPFLNQNNKKKIEKILKKVRKSSQSHDLTFFKFLKKLPNAEEFLSLLELRLVPSLLVCKVLPQTRSVGNAFTIDASLLPSPYYF